MKTALRLTIGLLIWLGGTDAVTAQTSPRGATAPAGDLDRPRPVRASSGMPRVSAVTVPSTVVRGSAAGTGARPTALSANDVTVSIANDAGLTEITAPNGTVSGGTTAANRATFNTIPNASTQGTLRAFTADGTTSIVVAAATEYNLATYPRLAFTPVATYSGTINLTYSLRQSGGTVPATSGNANYVIRVSTPPTAQNLTALIMPASFGITPLSQDFVGADSDGSIQSYIVKTLPASGILYITRNAAGATITPAAVTAGQSLTPTQAATLAFDPAAGSFGTMRFTYAAVDNIGLESEPAGYAIPVSKATCGQASALDFATRPTNPAENWAVNGKTVTVDGVTITTGDYTTTTVNGSTSSLSVRAGTNAPGTSLNWESDYGSGTTATQIITFNFSRPLKNFSFTVSDIDQLVGNQANSGWTDELQVDGYAGASGGTAYALTSGDVSLGSNGSNTLLTGNRIRSQNDFNNFGVDGNVLITFPVAIQRVTLRYRNLQTSPADPGGQFIGIHSFSWCSQADLTTSIAPLTSPINAGQQGQFNVSFGNAADQDVANNVVRTVQLPAGLTNVVVVDNGVTIAGAYDAATGLVTYPVLATLASGTTRNSTITFTAPPTGPVSATSTIGSDADENGVTGNNTSSTAIGVNPFIISGTVFEDVNFGGGVGRNYSTANTSATGSGFANNAVQRAGATVELYNSAGALVATTTTNSTGSYSFNAPAAGDYRVRVVNSTVTSLRTGYTSALLPVQTFVYGNVNRVGGEAPEKQDAAANNGSQTLASLTAGTATPQSLVTITASTSGVTGVDFGFNFDVITNTNDAGQGSLRQFLLNSNALANTNLSQTGLTAGLETSIFMIPDGVAHNGLRSGLVNQLTNGAATITLSSALPNITDASTALNGSTQTTNVGNSNAVVTTAGSESTGPEVIVNFGGTDGFATTAANTRVIGMGFTNANTGAGSGSAALRVDAGATSAIIQNNTFYSNGANFRLNNVGGATVSGNISRNALASNSDGIEMTASSNNTITNNQFLNNAGYGIDFISGVSNGNTITGNVFSGNGQNSSNGQTAGIGLRDASSNNIITGNTFTANVGDGISARDGSNNVFSQNSFSANGNLGIDLTTGAAFDGDGVTLNDAGDVDANTAQANGLINFPVITSSTIRNGNLIVQGFARPGVTVELYVADPDGTGFGEGQTFFNSFVEGSTADTNAGTGSYSGLINGRNQGTDNTNRFTVTIALSSLTAAQRTALTAAGAQLTALATLTTNTGGNYGTSEFSGNSPVFNAPVAINDAGTTAPATAITLTVTTNDQNSIDPATVALNGLAAGSTTAVSVTGGTFQFLSNGQVQFTPTAGFTGIATVPYTVNNTSGVTSNTAFITVDVRNPSIDLSTTITAPANNTAINAGAALTYVVVATNGTATAASTVVETLQLPAGLTTNGGTVTITGGQNFASASYSNATGLVTIPVGTLAGNSSQTYNVAVSAMPGTGPVTATANISGAVTETNTANNAVATTVTINPRYDVATTITGPATGVVRGNEITYTVTTSNLSTTAGSVSPAPNVVQVVQLPTGLTGVFASNGGTYNSTDGKVTFPAIGSLPVGQTVVNSISFAAPGANFTVPSATVTAGASNDNAGDLNSPSAGTNNNTAYLNNLASTAAVTTVAPSSSQVNVYTNISSSATNVAPNASVTLTVTASNAGPATATAVTETLQLPAGLTGVTVSNSGSYNPNTGLVTFTSFGDLAPAGSASATVTFNAPAQGFVLASATVMTTATDLVPADNLAQIKVEVAPVANVATTLAGPTTVVPGQTATYTVTTSSLGEATAVGVVQTVSLPAGLTGVTVSGGSYNPNTGLVTFSAGALSKGTTQTNSISFTVPAGATNYSAVANVSTTTPETVLTNNAATVATTVQQTADLVERVSGPSTAGVGSAVTYTVTTTNNGPSAAASVVPTLQLPAGLGTVVVTGGGSYDNASGLVTFSTVATLLSGTSTTNTATFIMPDASSVNGLARATSATAEANLDNNFASVATAGATPGAGTANVGTTIATGNTLVAPNTQMGIVANFTNASGSSPATNVTLGLQLPAGLTGVTVSGGSGGSYNPTTGLVTWDSPGTINGGATLTGYQVVFNSPSNGGTFTATSFISSATPETTLANNANSLTVTVAPSADVATGISGPTTTQPGATVTYAVTTLNNGVSAASSTQTVRIPDTATNIVVPSGSSQAAPAGGFITITFPAISNQPSGAAGQVTNYVSFTAPSAAYSVSAALTPGTTDGDNAGNNSASISTSINRAPVAYNVVNALQTPEANTAAALLISPLVATDADGNTLTYTITAVPASTVGQLFIGSSTTPLAANATVTAAQINTLRFDPAAGFIGNAFFSYTATDNATAPATSNTAIYTIAVGQDVNSAYASAPNRGGSASNYSNGDLIGYLFDANSARYAGTGTFYNTSVANGTLISGADTGVRTTTTDAAGTTQLNTLGLTLDPATGEIRVTNRNLLRGGSYTINVTTVDANGGTNTQAVTFSIGFGPLPVTLVEFTAKAQGDAALLTWKTAQEKDNDHFDVERSIDGLHFEKVGQVAGHGNSTVQQQYSFTDQGASRLAGTVYYRLQQVDTDGTTTASEAKVVSFGKTAAVELTLFPNPASETLNVRLAGAAGISQVTVYSTTGALVLQGKLAGALSTAFDVRALPAGTYLVKVLAANGQSRISRFVKY
ncbi:right-handed parallel beta-helix repeat-containing protein [Hymenobacter edaphi]|nr:right-handed parallel beta-helix repeat-containing protein [Hymenobacter edaphi]